jgi:prepilin-type N-terminal cleavage/methylation domain-containing protein
MQSYGSSLINSAKSSRLGTDAGFSLVELMVVVSIISVLGLIAHPNYTKFVDRAKTNSAKATMSSAKAGIMGLREIDERNLIGITGSFCSACLSGRADGSDPINWTPSAGDDVWKRIGFDGTPKDGWGRMFLLDENEEEFNSGDCRFDALVSAGPDHIYSGTGDGDDVFGDDVILRIPYYNKRNCNYNVNSQFGGQ